MTEDHLKKELLNLQNRFPRLDKDYLFETLRKNGGHAGKTTQYIFKEGGEGVEEAEGKFNKKYPGALLDVKVTQDHVIYLWDTRYNARFNRNQRSIKTKDLDGKEVTLSECNSLMICEDERETKYPNHDYFYRLAIGGEPSTSTVSDWGTDPYYYYDEFHPLNTKGAIMTIYELRAILNVWKIPLLGNHPYTNEAGETKMYVGIESRNKTKEKLPEGWTRRGCEEYNGLYCYYNNGKIQWKHPSE